MKGGGGGGGGPGIYNFLSPYLINKYWPCSSQEDVMEYGQSAGIMKS